MTDYLVAVTQRATDWHFTDFMFVATAEPDIAFVEFQGRAFVLATGKKYR